MENIKFKDNWDETRQRFDAWFSNKKTDRPLMRIFAHRNPDELPCEKLPELPFDDFADQYLNVEKNYARAANFFTDLKPMAESFPQFSMNLGAGSMALYLGGEPDFAEDTVWFKHFITDYDSFLPFKYDPDNQWWKTHLDIIKKQVELTKNTDIMVCIPDIIENIDILSAMRDPQTCCFDLYDYQKQVASALQNIQDCYMTYYDTIYDIVKKDGVSSYTAFDIMGTGKTAKIQCDFAALMAPDQFDEYILPSLKYQCDNIDNTLFHLDGKECIVHIDSLMSIEKLGTLQWMPGAGNPGAESEQWYPLYKKVKEADKGLWISLTEYTPEEAVFYADTLVRKFGAKGFYFHFPNMTESQAEALMIKAEKEWHI